MQLREHGELSLQMALRVTVSRLLRLWPLLAVGTLVATIATSASSHTRHCSGMSLITAPLFLQWVVDEKHQVVLAAHATLTGGTLSHSAGVCCCAAVHAMGLAHHCLGSGRFSNPVSSVGSYTAGISPASEHAHRLCRPLCAG